jgi:hypothetical protein
MQDLLQKYRNIESKTLPKDGNPWGSFSSWSNVVEDYEMFGDEIIFDIQDDYAYVLVNDHQKLTVCVLTALPGSEIKATLRCLGAMKKVMKENNLPSFLAVCRKETSWPILEGMAKKGRLEIFHQFTEEMGEEMVVVYATFVTKKGN